MPENTASNVATKIKDNIVFAKPNGLTGSVISAFTSDLDAVLQEYYDSGSSVLPTSKLNDVFKHYFHYYPIDDKEHYYEGFSTFFYTAKNLGTELIGDELKGKDLSKKEEIDEQLENIKKDFLTNIEQAYNDIISLVGYCNAYSTIQSLVIFPSDLEARTTILNRLDEYNNIPHLLIPVVTDAKKASAAMQWAVSEMTMRYRMFANAGAKDLERYNRVIAKEDKEPLPKIVIIIDELADLMMVSKKEVEDSICRIAQLGRAAGIHLVIATQRPSVDVITGLIKANIPSRIALTVSSQQDSRTILDRGGAEKLLGRGDMLFHPTGAPKSLRVQGCYIDDREIQDLCAFIKSNTQAEYDNKVIEDISKDKNDLPEDEDDQTDVLFAKALKLVVESDQASISMIQRRLRVGYARAARLIDEMEIRGYVSEFEGSKARKVLITKEQYNELYGDVEGTIE